MTPSIQLGVPRSPSRAAVCITIFLAELAWIIASSVWPSSEPAGGIAALLLYHLPSLSRLVFPFLLFGLCALMILRGGPAQPLALAWRPLTAHAASLAVLWFAVSAMTGVWLALLAAAAGAAALWTLAELASPAASLPRWNSPVWPAALLAALFGVLASRLTERSWDSYSGWTVAAVQRLLSALGYTATADGTQVGVPAFSVTVAPGCSGYEGMGLIFGFSVCWLIWFRRDYRFPAALLLLPAGVALSWLLNVVRIAALILIGAAGRRDIAMQGFHSQAGWIAFTLLAVAFCWLSHRIPGIGRASTRQMTYPAAMYLAPFLALQAGAMIASAASAGFEWLYPLRVVFAVGAFWYFRAAYRTEIEWRPAWTAGSISAGLAVAALWIAMSPPVSSSPFQTLAQAGALWQWTWLAFRVFGGVIAAPVAEELAFRGHLMRAWPGWAGFVVSSLAFGAMHGPRWMEGALAGAVYGGLYARRGRLGDAMLAHAVTNLVLIGFVAFTGDARYW